MIAAFSFPAMDDLPKRRDAEDVEVEDLVDVEELPKYLEAEEKSENRKKMAIKVRQFAGQQPTLVWINPEWSVAEVEQRLAEKWGKSPRATRLALEGRPLPREAKFINLLPQIEGKVLDTIAVHPVGL